jgi:hypothetical protein
MNECFFLYVQNGQVVVVVVVVLVGFI